MIQIRGDMSVSPQPANGQICAMFAADIADFTRADRNEEIQLDLRAAMYDMLRAAFDGPAFRGISATTTTAATAPGSSSRRACPPSR